MNHVLFCYTHDCLLQRWVASRRHTRSVASWRQSTWTRWTSACRRGETQAARTTTRKRRRRESNHVDSPCPQVAVVARTSLHHQTSVFWKLSFITFCLLLWTNFDLVCGVSTVARRQRTSATTRRAHLPHLSLTVVTCRCTCAASSLMTVSERERERGLDWRRPGETRWDGVTTWHDAQSPLPRCPVTSSGECWNKARSGVTAWWRDEMRVRTAAAGRQWHRNCCVHFFLMVYRYESNYSSGCQSLLHGLFTADKCRREVAAAVAAREDGRRRRQTRCCFRREGICTGALTTTWLRHLIILQPHRASLCQICSSMKCQ